MRSVERLARQTETVEKFLAWSFDAQEASSSSSSGWRPTSRGPRDDPDAPAESEWDDEPRFCAAVRRHVDRWPGYMQALVPQAIDELDLTERIALEAIVRDQLDPAYVTEHWPELVRTADRYRPLSAAQRRTWLVWEWIRLTSRVLVRRAPASPMQAARAALEHIARAVWDDDGAPRFERWGAAAA